MDYWIGVAVGCGLCAVYAFLRRGDHNIWITFATATLVAVVIIIFFLR